MRKMEFPKVPGAYHTASWSDMSDAPVPTYERWLASDPYPLRVTVLDHYVAHLMQEDRS